MKGTIIEYDYSQLKSIEKLKSLKFNWSKNQCSELSMKGEINFLIYLNENYNQ